MDKTKKIKPGSLLSGQIDNERYVGDKKIINDKNCKIFLSVKLNCNFRHL